MGKANRERRRIKQKTRARAHQGSGSGRRPVPAPGDVELQEFLRQLAAAETAAGTRARASVPPPTVAEQVTELLDRSMDQLDAHRHDAFETTVTRLAHGTAPGWRPQVERTLLDRLLGLVTALWRGGWQPADLVRLVGRRLDAAHLLLARDLMAAELAGYAPTTIDRRWADQIAAEVLAVWWEPQLTAITSFARAHPHDWDSVIRTALQLGHLCARLPRIELTCPIPGTAAATARAAGVDERVLTRVRALLAKAESTDYPAEAETFTAGAQALMARHSIDHALLAATGRVPSDEPGARRIGIENPYEGPKTSLLNAVATANNCRAVWTKEFGFVTIIGFPTDLDLVEVLFTSLLVQATAAMTREGSKADRYGRSRTRGFRQSFLVAYASRIGERLTEATRQQTAEAAAAGAPNLLPVLASRADAVAAASQVLFPALRLSSGARVTDREGWACGRAAADRARLGAGDALPG